MPGKASHFKAEKVVNRLDRSLVTKERGAFSTRQVTESQCFVKCKHQQLPHSILGNLSAGSRGYEQSDFLFNLWVDDVEFSKRLTNEESVCVIPGGHCFGDGTQTISMDT